MGTFGHGPLTARMCILVDYPKVPNSSSPFTDWERNFVEEKLRRVGVSPSTVRFQIYRKNRYGSSSEDFERFLSLCREMPNLTTVVTMGEASLKELTGRTGLDKWHSSPLVASPVLPVRKVMPTFTCERIIRQWDLALWFELALKKAADRISERQWPQKDYRFLLNPPNEVKFRILEMLRSKEELSVDIETGNGQINTVGFAWTPEDAIAINVLPGNYGAETFRDLWVAIAKLIEGPSRKIMQNGIYETLYFATYGISLRNFHHDTMWAQKMLWPEFEKGLDAVGRMYTMEPYWKDVGKETLGDGKKKDWGNVRDWEAHYKYNCLDTTGTYEAFRNQVADIEARGMSRLWRGHLMRFADPISEMCLRGIPIREEARLRIKAKVEAEIEELTKGLSSEINPRSSKQKLELFRAKGYKLPKVRDPQTKQFRESTNELALKKLRLKYPEDQDIKILLDLSHKQKAVSAYLDVSYKGDRVNFMLDAHGTETGRFSCTKDHRGLGFNAQTLPKYAKKFVGWPEGSNRTFVQCDLKQAESRFVAYDSADLGLIEMLEDPTKDIHSYVAAEIFGCSVEQVIAEKNAGNPSKRQLGKKSGHGANYSMKETTFMDSCLKEMDLVLSKKEATNVLEAYHRLFPGIRRWHAALRQEVRQTKTLRNPFGRVRHFYGRMDDDTFREAYAYRPQSTVPDITNTLMLKLWDARLEGKFDFWFHLQCHDSLTLSCDPDEVDKITRFMLDVSLWHPEIVLAAGRLIIPTSVEVGPSLGELEEYEPN